MKCSSEVCLDPVAPAVARVQLLIRDDVRAERDVVVVHPIHLAHLLRQLVNAGAGRQDEVERDDRGRVLEGMLRDLPTV
jgi:hypothetical protein